MTPSLPLHRSSILLLLLLALLSPRPTHQFQITGATVEGIHEAFRRGKLTSRALVELYLDRIRRLNPILHAVIEVNPDALRQADAADAKREEKGGEMGPLDGIPVLLKDNIATKDALNTTAGSLALVGSVVTRDAGVVRRLREAGAVVLGKASLSEWANFRSMAAPDGWSARGGQGKVCSLPAPGKPFIFSFISSKKTVAWDQDPTIPPSDRYWTAQLARHDLFESTSTNTNPYNLSTDPCGSSSGSAIAAAANMASVTLGTERDGSILCPSGSNSVVGIKPTVGLTSRSGVIPISPRQDSIGPICRTVSDAVRVMDVIVGYDPLDAKPTRIASKFIPRGGYLQFLKVDGLKGKRLGILRQFFNYSNDPHTARVFEEHLQLLRREGAIVVDNVEIANAGVVQNPNESGEAYALLAEFKVNINKYLRELTSSPVRSLQDLIDFNNNNRVEERIDEFGQDIFLVAQNTTFSGPIERAVVRNLRRFCKEGLEKLMKERRLDAVITPEANAAPMLAIGGYPGISVPAGYRGDGSPFGICFGGLRGSEPKLIEIAYGFEQATLIRKPPLIN